MIISLAKRLAFVTGAGSGIGKETAWRFAKAGATVAAVDFDQRAAESTAAAINHQFGAETSVGIQADVSDLSSVKNAIEVAQVRLSGDLATAVNCAGITVDGFLLKQTEDQWDRVMDVNLKGTFFVTQAAAAAMIQSGVVESPSITNISSIVGKSGNLGQANYAASKGGVVSFTKTAAVELARQNIRVNCILPGFIETPMALAVPDKVKIKFMDEIPLKRFGTPKEIADMCVFLASESSTYITGAAIEITGGYNM